eukprot:m.182669 g.182669  ORF g.182669 m.182669 type:complete len:90 (+) comp14673_c1_seq1:142-411(+)
MAEEPLALPDKAANPEKEVGGTTTVEVDGEPVKMDALGPVVINTDGTISRIENWHDMSPLEQERTLRLIGKRNRKRRAQLEAQGVVAKP